MVMVKKVVVLVNKELQIIFKSVVNVIIVVCDEVLNNGKCMDQFLVDVFQGGVGIFVNMNINEVLVNIGFELMGYQKGEYQYLNLNDYVNKCQFINDVYFIGFCIVVYVFIFKLIDVIKQLGEGFQVKVVEFQDIFKMGCIQLQDVVLMIFGQEFYVFNVLFNEEIKSILCIVELLLEVNFGVIVIGICFNILDGY